MQQIIILYHYPHHLTRLQSYFYLFLWGSFNILALIKYLINRWFIHVQTSLLTFKISWPTFIVAFKHKPVMQLQYFYLSIDQSIHLSMQRCSLTSRGSPFPGCDAWLHCFKFGSHVAAWHRDVGRRTAPCKQLTPRPVETQKKKSYVCFAWRDVRHVSVVCKLGVCRCNPRHTSLRGKGLFQQPLTRCFSVFLNDRKGLSHRKWK